MANLKPGDGAIAFTLPGVDDKQHALADYADREAVAVIFSCNHCPYVRVTARLTTTMMTPELSRITTCARPWTRYWPVKPRRKLRPHL
ncbi:MAG: hypothetical protein P8186_02820 [Anaerolineae bacterium]